MNELRTLMNKKFLELAKQLDKLCKNHKEKPPDGPNENPLPEATRHPYYQYVVDLDNPPYATSVLQNLDYTPTKHLKVNMPRFDGTNVEHWIFAVRRYFIFKRSLWIKNYSLFPSTLMGLLARKWFAWLEASLLTTWKNFVDVVIRKFTTLTTIFLGVNLNKLCQEGTVANYQAKFEEMCT